MPVSHRSEVTMTPKPWSSAYEIAEHAPLTTETVYSWTADQSMPANKAGRMW